MRESAIERSRTKTILRITSSTSTSFIGRRRQRTILNCLIFQLWMYLLVIVLSPSFGLYIPKRRHQEQHRFFVRRCNNKQMSMLNIGVSSRESLTLFDSKDDDHHNEYVDLPILHYIHHTAIKTRNITLAMSFYSLFGYCTEFKFRAGPARAVWLTLPHHQTNSRIELIEVPTYMLRNERAPDLLFTRPDILGYNHIAIDVTHQIQYQLTSNNDDQSSPTSSSSPSLTTYLQYLNRTSIQRFNKTLRMALYPPQQQMIGRNVYEIAFLYDADGALIELLHCTAAKLQQNITSGWEPWDSTTFL